jgi:hypothetical protein
MRSLRRALIAASAAAIVVAAGCVQNPAGPPPPDDGRYVAPTGVDEGDCSASASPCATITYAQSQAVDGETIHVAAGTYPELVIVTKSLTFEGANAGRSDGAHPVARGAESVVKGFRTPGEPHATPDGENDITIDGFTIDPQGDASLIAPDTHHLVGLFGGEDVEVLNNRFVGGPWVPDCVHICTEMTDAALMIRSGTYLVSGNSFTNFRRPVDVSQYSAEHPVVSGTFTGNSFTHMTSRAIWISEHPGGPLPNTITVTDNVFDATGWTGDSYPAAIVVTAGGNTVTANTFAGFSSAIFLQVCDGTNVDGVPNTFTGNSFVDNRSGLHFFVAAPCGATTVAATISGNSFDGGIWGGPDAVEKIGVRWNEVGGPRPNELVAECNWWGAATGPNTPGASTITAGVDATPWSTAPGGPCDGV